MSALPDDIRVAIVYGVVFTGDIEYIGITTQTRVQSITQKLRMLAARSPSATAVRLQLLCLRLHEQNAGFQVVLLGTVKGTQLERMIYRDSFIVKYKPKLNKKLSKLKYIEYCSPHNAGESEVRVHASDSDEEASDASSSAEASE